MTFEDLCAPLGTIQDDNADYEIQIATGREREH